MLKPLHIFFALVLKRMQGTLGPVFAERATTVLLPPARLGAQEVAAAVGRSGSSASHLLGSVGTGLMPAAQELAASLRRQA